MTKDSKDPVIDKTVVGLRIVPDKKPPIKILDSITIKAERYSFDISKISITIFDNPNFRKGKGFGIKLSTTYIVTAIAVNIARCVIDLFSEVISPSGIMY